MKKPKTLESRLRAAIRLIWSRSAQRRAILKEAAFLGPLGPTFKCPICEQNWPLQMAEVDHEPPIGTLERWQDVGEFINKMFFGPQRAICKICHKKKTARQRQKSKKAK